MTPWILGAIRSSGTIDRSKMSEFTATVAMNYIPDSTCLQRSFAIRNFSRLPVEFAPTFLPKKQADSTPTPSDGDDTLIQFIIVHGLPAPPVELYVRVRNSFQYEFFSRHGPSFGGFPTADDAYQSLFFRLACLLITASTNLQYNVKPNNLAIDDVLTIWYTELCIDNRCLSSNEQSVWVFYVRIRGWAGMNQTTSQNLCL